MQKRDGLLLKNIASVQIFLVIFSIFSFAFLISETSNVVAQAPSGTTTETNRFTGTQSSVRPVETPGPKGVVKLAPGVNPAPATTVTQRVWGLSESAKLDLQTKIDVPANSIDGFSAPLPNGNYNVIGQNGEIIDTIDKATYDSLISDIPAKGGHVTGQFQGGPFGTTGWLGHLAQGLSTALFVVGAIQLIGGLAGWDDSLTNSLSIAAGSGIMATAAINALGPGGTGTIGGEFLFTDQVAGLTGAGIVGIVVAVVVFALMYKKESTKIVNFQCLPYEAPVGGNSCEECNGDPYRPCSEYRCRALGQACEIVNTGTSDEKCVWVNPNDATSPTITPWTEPLTDNHRYTNHETRPTSLGTKIVYNNNANGCLQAFTPLKFGIITNEPAQCKIDIDHKDTFDEMQFFLGNTNLYSYNHTQQFSLPSPNALNDEAPELLEDGKYDFFIRCRDKNGNENVDEYAIQLCVDPSPDTTAPVIVDTSIPSDSYVKFGVQSVPVEFYVNEPSTCKWSNQDKEYSVMENTMRCATSLTQINARELYTCATSLTGIADRQVNNFFIRCKDQPSKPEEERNVNVVSYKYNLKGSQPLNIIFTSPNGTVTGNTNTVPVELKVTTDDGAGEGIAICSFSPSGNPASYIMMFETNAVEHTQKLNLPTGNYNYKFRCVDYGGNAAEAETSFTVIVDTFAPLVTRAYRDSSNNALKLVTNEDAECAYSLNSCNFNFDEGIEMLYLSALNKKNHYSEWKPNVAYYIKCKDVFNNEPGPNTCSLVASATNIR